MIAPKIRDALLALHPDISREDLIAILALPHWRNLAKICFPEERARTVPETVAALDEVLHCAGNVPGCAQVDSGEPKQEAQV